MKKSNYRIFVLAIALLAGIFYTTQVGAQDHAVSPTKEVGIRLHNLNSFGMIYKKKKADQQFRRRRLGIARIAFNSLGGRQSFQLETTVAFGVEKRRTINDKFQFVHGAEFIGSLDFDVSGARGKVAISPGVGFVLGFNYALSSSLYLGVETIPSVSTRFVIDEDGFRDNFSLNAGFNSQAASLSLVYCFNG